MTEFFLRRKVDSSTYRLPITLEQYADLDDAITTQWETLYLEQKFDFVLENYLEFEETILKCGLEHMILGRGLSRSFDMDTSLFNRRIMNFLTTYKTYVDSFPQHFNRIFFRDEEITSSAERSFSEEYDSRIGYWILPKLRNFVQHKGFPVHGSSYASEWVLGGENSDQHRNRYTIDLFVTPEELSKGDFNQEVLARFKTMNKKIDLKFLIRDFMEGFSAAHVRNRALLTDKLEWAGNYIKSAESEFLGASGDDSVVALAAISTQESYPPIYMHQIANDQHAYLVKKNGTLVNLSSRYISNEIFSDKVVKDIMS